MPKILEMPTLKDFDLKNINNKNKDDNDELHIFKQRFISPENKNKVPVSIFKTEPKASKCRSKKGVIVISKDRIHRANPSIGGIPPS
jgi:hypothetical protein